MILANKNGQMIEGIIERKTAKAAIFVREDSKSMKRVLHADTQRRIFGTVKAAEKWIRDNKS